MLHTNECIGSYSDQSSAATDTSGQVVRASDSSHETRRTVATRAFPLCVCRHNHRRRLPQQQARWARPEVSTHLIRHGRPRPGLDGRDCHHEDDVHGDPEQGAVGEDDTQDAAEEKQLQEAAHAGHDERPVNMQTGRACHCERQCEQRCDEAQLPRRDVDDVVACAVRVQAAEGPPCVHDVGDV